MKGIILAGGKGTRLYPMTKVISKQLLSIYDKPMIYYPISTLMLSGIREILIISTKEDLPLYRNLLGTGKDLGMKFEYKVQDKPRGLADAFILGEEFIGKDSVCLGLGDNIFYGHSFTESLRRAVETKVGATIFGYPVKNPKEFGVVEFDKDKNVVSLEEKPQEPKSNYAIPGLYFYDNDVIEIAKNVKPSKRGEIEITSINNEYFKKGKLKVEVMNRGIAWLDTGNPKNMLRASSFVEEVEEMQGLYIACLEEIAYNNGYINKEKLQEIAKSYNNNYGKYLQKIVERGLE